MKVTVCQWTPNVGDVNAAFDSLAEHIAAEQSDFLLLPEMPFFDWLAAEETPDPVRWQQAVAAHEQRLSDLNSLGVKAVLSSRPIVNGIGSFRNEAFLWTEERSEPAAIREKYYLPDEPGYYEHRWYDRGEKRFDLARALDMRIGVQICTEMWFFEWARHFAASRADLLCIPRATPHGSTDKWLAGGRAAAVCSGAYCLSSNLWAPEGHGPSLGGLGWIIDPEGNILTTTSPDKPFATAQIDLDFARTSKTTYPRDIPE